jgi:hypothetical protein
MRNGAVKCARQRAASLERHRRGEHAHGRRAGALWRDLKRVLLALFGELEDRLRDPNQPIRVLLPE